MSLPNDPRRGPAAPQGAPDPIEEILARYARATDVQPAPDLSARILGRIAEEPQRPAGRYLAALASLRPTRIRASFSGLVRVAAGRGRYPALVRAQALGLAPTEIGESGARPRTTDHAVDRDPGFAVTHQHELGHANFSTKPSSCRRLRHSYTPSVWLPYSPTMESPVFQ